MSVDTPVGSVLRDSDGMRLEFLRTFDAPAAEVWAGLTHPDRVAGWLGRWTGDPASGAVELVMTAEEGAPGDTVTIVDCQPPHYLAVQMPTPDGTWDIAATVTEAGDAAKLQFVQRLTEPYDASSIGPGWHFYLDRLGAVIAGLPVPEDWDDYFPALANAYALPD